MSLSANQRMSWIAVAIFAADQLTKQIVMRFLKLEEEKVVIDGFFKFVHWGNTGAAYSMFRNNNDLLAIVSLIALAALVFWRHQFDTRSVLGQVSLGLIFGGIVGNVWDRLFVGHVVDFIRFYVHQRSGREQGFPAFNIADSAICVGVGLLFILSLRQEEKKDSPAPTK